MWFGARGTTYVVNSTKTQNIENVTCDNIQLKGNSGIVWSEIHLAELETTTWEPGGVMSCWFACCHSEHDLINTYWLKDQVVSSLKCIWHFPVIEHAVSWVYGPRITKHFPRNQTRSCDQRQREAFTACAPQCWYLQIGFTCCWSWNPSAYCTAYVLAPSFQVTAIAFKTCGTTNVIVIELFVTLGISIVLRSRKDAISSHQMAFI